MVKLLFNFRFFFCLSLVQVDSFLLKVSTETDHHKPQQATTNVVLVTDGQLPLRQCLLPETCTKGIAEPPAVLSFFYDLRKEFRKGFPNAPEINSIQDMINRKSTIFFDTLKNRSALVRLWENWLIIYFLPLAFVWCYIVGSFLIFHPSSRIRRKSEQKKRKKRKFNNFF